MTAMLDFDALLDSDSEGGSEDRRAAPVTPPRRPGSAPTRRSGARRSRPRCVTSSRRTSLVINPAGEGPVVGVAFGVPGTLRITRRGRLALTLVVVAGVGLLVALSITRAPADGGRPAAVTQVVVGAGDTLWQIAAEVAPTADPSETVARLRAANGLGVAPLHAGQVLQVPAA